MTYFTSNIYLSGSPSQTRTIPASSLVPLKVADRNEGTLEFEQTKVRFRDGYTVYQAEPFRDTKDVKYNRESLVVLTSSYPYKVLITNSDKIDSITDYIETYGFVYAHVTIQIPGTTIAHILANYNGEAVASLYQQLVEAAKIAKTPNGKYAISIGGKYLTVTEGSNLCTFEELSLLANKTQAFSISFQQNLFITTNNGQFLSVGADKRIRTTGFTSNEQYLYNTITTGVTSSFARNSVFQLLQDNLGPYTFDALPEKSTSWVAYYNELANKENLKNVNINESKSFDDIAVNHLFITPVESQVDPANETIYVNHLPLKNVMTPEQNYAVAPKRREYTKVFTGDKDVDGYEKPLLGFTADTKLITLKADEPTYFHYPFEAPQLSLADAKLQESGAIPGATPFNADRIFKKNADYRNYSHWGDSQQIFGCDDGQWLCAWLSGSNNSSLSGMDTSIWVDRWYNPSKISGKDALEVGYTQLTIQQKNPAFFDVPTELTFDPGVYYKYDRVNTQRLEQVVSTYNIEGSALRLHYKDEWAEIVPDQSNYNNRGNVTNFNSALINNEGPAFGQLEQKSLRLTEGSYINVPFSNTVMPSGSFTISTWVHSRNWKNNPGSAVVSTNFRGGASIDYTKHFFNPTVSVIEDSYSHVLQYSLCSPLADSRVTFTSLINGVFGNFDWTWFGLSLSGANPLSWEQLSQIDGTTWAYTTSTP